MYAALITNRVENLLSCTPNLQSLQLPLCWLQLQVLRKGLLKAAKTTGAWIFTGGTNTGKELGENAQRLHFQPN